MTLIYLVAGEPSGYVLGGRLMADLNAARPDLTFAGIGGPHMLEQGLSSLFPMRELAVLGLLEVLPKLHRLRGLLHQAAADIAARQPAVLVTIDSPGFTLRLLRLAAPTGIKRVHYVAPQVWAWREGRVKHFPGLWDRLLCLLPFEVGFYARHGLAAQFVGHPVLESGAGAAATPPASRAAYSACCPPMPRVLALLPGSRRGEVRRLLPGVRRRTGTTGHAGARPGAGGAGGAGGGRDGAARRRTMAGAAAGGDGNRGQVRRLRRRRRRADQVRHLDPGTGAGRRADGGSPIASIRSPRRSRGDW